MSRVDLVAYAAPLAWAAAVTVALVLAVALARPRRDALWKVAVLGLVLAPYGFGSIVTANRVLDRSAPSVHEVRVVGKRCVSGKNARYALTLAPWAARAAPSTVGVSARACERIEPGETVRLLLRDGALGMPWYAVAPEP
jgi:hypothetical protein